MSNFKPIDGKRDDFRKYLERTGVIEALSKTFVKLIHERPENAIEFICENLGYRLHQNDLIESLREELDVTKNELAQLKNFIGIIKNNGDDTNVVNTSKEDEDDDDEDDDVININNQTDDKNNETPSSTTELIKTVTEIENKLKNLNIDDQNDNEPISKDIVIEVAEKKMVDEIITISEKEENITSTSASEPAEPAKTN